jgi:hypothetical protein
MMRLLGLAMSVALMASGPDDGPQLASALTTARPASATPMMMRAESAGMVGETDHSVASMEKEAQTDPVFCVDSIFVPNDLTAGGAQVTFKNTDGGFELFFLRGQRVAVADCAQGPTGDPPKKTLRLKDAKADVVWKVLFTFLVNDPDPNAPVNTKSLLVVATHTQAKTKPSPSSGPSTTPQPQNGPRPASRRFDDVGGILTISIDGDDCIAFPVVCVYSS